MDIVWRGDSKAVAKQLFGRPVRLALAAWIIGRADQAFYLQEAQDALRRMGESDSGVAEELRRFEAHGMVASLPSGRRVYFSAIESPYWEAFRKACEALGLLEPEH